MSVRRLVALMRGLGYKRAEASSRTPAQRRPAAISDGLAKLVAMKPKDMGIVYTPKVASDG